MESNCAEVEKRITNLPETNTIELGQAKRTIATIRRDLDRLKQFTRIDPSEVKVNQSKEEARRLTGDIATQYSELDAILSSLLNRILENIGQAKL